MNEIRPQVPAFIQESPVTGPRAAADDVGLPVEPVPCALSEVERSSLGVEAAERFDSMLDNLSHQLQTLADKPEETPGTALRALWLLAAGRPVSAQAAREQALCRLAPGQEDELRSLLDKRLAGVPLAHLTGRQRFMGVELLAGPEALIPRRETELVGVAAASLLAQIVAVRGEATALDVCTGSGNLAVGMAAAVPAARVLASDLSEEAVGLARRNVAHLGLGSRVEVRQGDLLDPFRDPELLGGVDVLVCNPPYISSGKLPSMPAEIARFEPSLAFDGGPFGIRFLVRLIKEAPLFLRPSSGWLAFEVGAGQGPSALNRLNAGGRFADVHTLKDEQGQVRAIVSRLAAN